MIFIKKKKNPFMIRSIQNVCFKPDSDVYSATHLLFFLSFFIHRILVSFVDYTLHYGPCNFRGASGPCFYGKPSRKDEVCPKPAAKHATVFQSSFRTSTGRTAEDNGGGAESCKRGGRWRGSMTTRPSKPCWTRCSAAKKCCSAAKSMQSRRWIQDLHRCSMAKVRCSILSNCW